MPAHSTYTVEKGDEICALIAGGKSMRTIAAMDNMPSQPTVDRWRADNEAFRLQYAHAMEQRGLFYADECIEIADDSEGDPVRDRLRVDARKWYASKLNPKVLGDKLGIGQADGMEPVKVQYAEWPIPAHRLEQPK